MSKENNKEEIPVPVVVDYTNDKVESEQNIPESYDLRNIDRKNYITPVRNQGNLGICWTFATAGAMESKILKENYSNNQTLISERQIDYATSTNGIKDYRSEYISFISRGLGEGGNFYIATVAMANGISLYNYNSYKEKSYVLKDLEKIKKSKKIVNFNYVKDNIDYSWIINGKKLNKLENLDTTINFDTDNKKKILTLSNYADGIFVNLKQNNSNMKGITLKVYVGNKYEKDDSINIYSYNNDKLSVLLKKIKMKDGYIEFKLVDTSDYFITMFTINNKEKENNSLNITLITIFVIVIIILIILYVFKGKFNFKNNKENTVKNAIDNTDVI